MNFTGQRGVNRPKIGLMNRKSDEKKSRIHLSRSYFQLRKRFRKAHLASRYIANPDLFKIFLTEMPIIKGGGTIFCRRSQWVVKNFPRGQFYDSKSKGGPVLMHSKVAQLQCCHISFLTAETDDTCNCAKSPAFTFKGK